jgi:DNA repair ATPase RecN
MEDEKTKLEPMKASAPPDPDRDLEERINKKYAELQAAEKELKKNANPTEFDKMNIELIRQNFDQLKARYEKKFGKPFEPK